MQFKYLLWIFLALILVGQTRCAKPLEPQEPCGFVQNGDGQRVSWKGQGPIRLYIDASVPQNYYQAIQNAINTWERTIGHKMFIIMGTVPASIPAQDGRSVIYWMNSWDSGLRLQQANTTIYWIDNQITEADIRINAQDFLYSDDPSYSQVDIESLVLHELGHSLGLKHEDSVPSVMAKALPSGYMRRNLYPADLNDIRCEY